MKDVPDKFEKMTDFIKFKEHCIFCQTPLRANLTNLMGIFENGLPVLDVLLEDGLFKFELKHTTAEFSLRADVTLNPSTNMVVFDNFSNGELPNIDAHLAAKVFVELNPTLELYCGSKTCKTKYHLTTHPLKMAEVTEDSRVWQILPSKILMESFRVRRLRVLNIWWPDKETWICNMKNEDAEPLRLPMIDFESMTKEHLFARIQTIVTFS
jgi:hypothetical protein